MVRFARPFTTERLPQSVIPFGTIRLTSRLPPVSATAPFGETRTCIDGPSLAGGYGMPIPFGQVTLLILTMLCHQTGERRCHEQHRVTWPQPLIMVPTLCNDQRPLRLQRSVQTIYTKSARILSNSLMRWMAS